jgi:hypothetical protein
VVAGGVVSVGVVGGVVGVVDGGVVGVVAGGVTTQPWSP